MEEKRLFDILKMYIRKYPEQEVALARKEKKHSEKEEALLKFSIKTRAEVEKYKASKGGNNSGRGSTGGIGSTSFTPSLEPTSQSTTGTDASIFLQPTTPTTTTNNIWDDDKRRRQ